MLRILYNKKFLVGFQIFWKNSIQILNFDLSALNFVVYFIFFEAFWGCKRCFCDQNCNRDQIWSPWPKFVTGKFVRCIRSAIEVVENSCCDKNLYWRIWPIFGHANFGHEIAPSPLQTAFDYLMEDYTWFWVVLEIKWGFLKFSNLRKIELVFRKQEKKNYIDLVSV